jgi:hypothetical protein
MKFHTLAIAFHARFRRRSKMAWSPMLKAISPARRLHASSVKLLKGASVEGQHGGNNDAKPDDGKPRMSRADELDNGK